MQSPQERSVPAKPIAREARKAILIIDDSIDLLDLLKTILKIDDYEIFTSLGGSEALKLLSVIRKPDLIFLDVQMDGMSGPDFLIALEERRPDLIKAVGYIHKPIDLIPFLEATRRFIALGTDQPAYRH
jgi:DNA-binding NtrC family response regulator